MMMLSLVVLCLQKPSFHSCTLTFITKGCNVPEVLVRLKTFLLGHGGLDQEGLFRVQADEKETQVVKDQLNHGHSIITHDVNSVAALIKVMLLPTIDRSRSRATCSFKNKISTRKPALYF